MTWANLYLKTQEPHAPKQPGLYFFVFLLDYVGDAIAGSARIQLEARDNLDAAHVCRNDPLLSYLPFKGNAAVQLDVQVRECG